MQGLKTRTYQIKSGHHVVCYRNPGNEKRRRKKFNSKTEAKLYQKQAEQKFMLHGAQGFNQTPVGQLMKEHLEKHPGSRVRERKNSFISFCEEFGSYPINQVGKVELQAWFKKIKEENDYSDRTLSSIKSNINAFFKDLEDQGVIHSSPLLKIQFDRKPPARRKRVILSVDEVRQILRDAEIESPDILYPILFVAAYTGARRGEVIKLKRSDVDFETGLLHFRDTKNGEDRAIRMGHSLKGFLSRHLSLHSSSYALPDSTGKMITRDKIARRMRRFKKHFPIGKDWGLHSLRHSYANNFLKMGGNMYQLQAVLGHKSIDVTVDTYGQLAAQDVENACPYEIDLPTPKLASVIPIKTEKNNERIEN